MAAFYRKFISGLTQTGLSWNKFIRNRVSFVWIERQQTLFDPIKTDPTSISILDSPDLYPKFKIEVKTHNTWIVSLLYDKISINGLLGLHSEQHEPKKSTPLWSSKYTQSG
jgi:hypothetical protein